MENLLMFLNSNKFNRFSDQWTFNLYHNKGLPKNVFTSLYGVLSLPDDVVLIRACRSVCVATKKKIQNTLEPTRFKNRTVKIASPSRFEAYTGLF